MKTIGLVGGVASGKSLVAKQFVELGAGLLDADRAGHEVLADDPAVCTTLVDRWGPSVLAADGSIDRTAVAARVFGDSDQATAEREFLESVLHPRIEAVLKVKKREFAAAGAPAVVLDAPLLLEASWGHQCDVIVMVDANRDTRLARSRERGWSDAEFARREAAQWPVEKKRSQAHAVIANHGSIDELRAAVRAVWEELIVG